MTRTAQARTQTTRTQYDTAENTSTNRGQNQGRGGRRGRGVNGTSRGSSRSQTSRGQLSSPSGRGNGPGHRLGGSTSPSHPQEGNPLLLAAERRIREAQEAKNKETEVEDEGDKGNLVDGDDDRNEDYNKI